VIPQSRAGHGIGIVNAIGVRSAPRVEGGFGLTYVEGPVMAMVPSGALPVRPSAHHTPCASNSTTAPIRYHTSPTVRFQIRSTPASRNWAMILKLFPQVSLFPSLSIPIPNLYLILQIRSRGAVARNTVATRGWPAYSSAGQVDCLHQHFT